MERKENNAATQIEEERQSQNMANRWRRLIEILVVKKKFFPIFLHSKRKGREREKTIDSSC